MDENPLDAVPAYNRLSLRAVVTGQGENPAAALAAAGIVHPVSFRCVVTDSADEAARVLGPSVTPHVAVVLEPAQGAGGGADQGGFPARDATAATANVSTFGAPRASQYRALGSAARGGGSGVGDSGTDDRLHDVGPSGLMFAGPFAPGMGGDE